MVGVALGWRLVKQYITIEQFSEVHSGLLQCRLGKSVCKINVINKKIVVNDNLTDPIAYVRQGNTFDVLPMFIDMTYWYMMYQAINSYTILFVIDVSIWIV